MSTTNITCSPDSILLDPMVQLAPSPPLTQSDIGTSSQISSSAAQDTSTKLGRPVATIGPTASPHPSTLQLPSFVHEQPMDPFSSVITIIVQNIETQCIDAEFAQSLIGLISTLRVNSSLCRSELESASIVREELNEVRRKLNVMQEMYDLAVGGRDFPSSFVSIREMDRGSSPSISPSDSASQGVFTQPIRPPSKVTSEASAPSRPANLFSSLPECRIYCNDNIWNSTPTIPSDAIYSLTWNQLKNHEYAKPVAFREPFDGLVPRVALWTYEIAKSTRGNEHVYKHPYKSYVLKHDGSPIDGSIQKSLINTMQADANLIASLLLKHTSSAAGIRGIQYFESEHLAVWDGAIAFMEGQHPHLQICMDHWKAKAFLFHALTNTRTNSNSSSRASSQQALATSPTALNPTPPTTASNLSHPPPRPSTRAPVQQPKSPQATIRAPTGKTRPPLVMPSPMKTQPKRGSKPISTPLRPGPSKRARAPETPLRLSSSSSASRRSPSHSPTQRSPTHSSLLSRMPPSPQDVDMSRPSSSINEEALLETAAAHGLGTNVLHRASSLPALPSGRLIVDISSLVLPAPTFVSLQSWLKLQATLIPNVTLTKLELIVDAMFEDPRHLPSSPSSQARRLALLLGSADPNSLELDNDEQNDQQFGHSVYSGEWRKATKSWQAIGKTDMALELLAGGIRIAEIAALISLKRHQPFTVPALCHIYLEQMVDSITHVWSITNGAAPRQPTESDMSRPRTAASKSTNPAARRTKAASSTKATAYSVDGTNVNAHPSLEPILRALKKEDLPPLIIAMDPSITASELNRLTRPALTRKLDELFLAGDDDFKF